MIRGWCHITYTDHTLPMIYYLIICRDMDPQSSKDAKKAAKKSKKLMLKYNKPPLLTTQVSTEENSETMEDKETPVAEVTPKQRAAKGPYKDPYSGLDEDLFTDEERLGFEFVEEDADDNSPGFEPSPVKKVLVVPDTARSSDDDRSLPDPETHRSAKPIKKFKTPFAGENKIVPKLTLKFSKEQWAKETVAVTDGPRTSVSHKIGTHSMLSRLDKHKKKTTLDMSFSSGKLDLGN